MRSSKGEHIHTKTHTHTIQTIKSKKIEKDMVSCAACVYCCSQCEDKASKKITMKLI